MCYSSSFYYCVSKYFSAQTSQVADELAGRELAHFFLRRQAEPNFKFCYLLVHILFIGSDVAKIGLNTSRRNRPLVNLSYSQA